MSKPVLLITGASGSIGKTLFHKLKGLGIYKIVTLGLAHESNDFKVDLRSTESQAIIREIDPDLVVHLAGNPAVILSFNDPVQDLKLNTLGTLNLLQGLNRQKRVVLSFANSAAIYAPFSDAPLTEDSPTFTTSPYAISKLAAESYIAQQSQQFGYSWSSLVISNSFGSFPDHQTGVISNLISGMKNGSSVVLNGRGTTRDFVHADDVCEAIIRSLAIPLNTRINVSSMQERSLLDIVNFIQEVTKVNIQPMWKEDVENSSKRNCLDNTKARDLLNWSPQRDFYSSLKEILINALS